jgi:hypothetical protein
MAQSAPSGASLQITLRRFFLSLFVLALTGCPTPTPVSTPPWAVVATGLPEALLSITGRSATDVWAVGADKGQGPIVLHYDGTAWTRVVTGTRGTLWWAHAFDDGTLFIGGAGSTILRSDGTTFTRMHTPGLAAHTVFGVWGTSTSDAYAVGSVSGRSGFVWHFDGTTWSEMALPEDLPVTALGDTPGFFKVWGDGAGHVYVVGGRGVLLRSTAGAAFERLMVDTDATLFTVSGDADRAYVVGGASNGVVLEVPHDGAPVVVTPALAPLLQGVSSRGGSTFASGAMAVVYTRGSAGWSEVDTDLPLLDIESLHATWIDPSGGVWAVGGDVLSTELDEGTIFHRGDDVATYDPRPPVPDGGVDGSMPPAVCPDAQIDPFPTGSMARRWNEQLIGAIRRDIPRPGVHARNLFHVSAAMWDAWATYDATADGVFYTTRTTATDIDLERHEAISRAAYRMLVHRYQSQTGGPVSVACFRAFMDRLGYDPDDTSTTGDGPSAVGNRIADAVIAATMSDGANEAMNYADTTMWMPTNPPLVVDEPGVTLTDPDHYQQLNLALAETQNGIVTPAGVQGYIGAQWGLVTPFAMTRSAPGALYHDPDAPPMFGTAEMADAIVDVIRRGAVLDHTDGEMIDISPGAYGNNPLGTDDGTGHPMNPVTSAAYAPNVVPRGDFARVLAEFWADGPRSETPPGHWFVLANASSDSPMSEHRIGGAGAPLDRLAWDVRMYLALGGAVHDAAITAWEIKRRFTCVRPISLVRHMASLGQSSDASGAHYDPNGLPIVDGLIELVTEASSAPGERHAHLRRYLGQIVVRAWRGEPGDRGTETGGVAWIRGIDWTPYQRRTFVTPAFPGFISGHSTFSRAAAEVLVELTGSAYFPGGLGEFSTTAGNYLVFEDGPSVDVRLQWATYYDAADQAGQSRIFGGIHIVQDDYNGRRLGSVVGMDAWARAQTYFDGTAVP